MWPGRFRVQRARRRRTMSLCIQVREFALSRLDAFDNVASNWICSWNRFTTLFWNTHTNVHNFEEGWPSYFNHFLKPFNRTVNDKYAMSDSSFFKASNKLSLHYHWLLVNLSQVIFALSLWDFEAVAQWSELLCSRMNDTKSPFWLRQIGCFTIRTQM